MINTPSTSLNTDGVIVPLSQNALVAQASLASEVSSLFSLEDNVTRARGLITLRIWKFINQNGAANVKDHATQLDYTTTSERFPLHVPVQFAMGVNIFHETTEKEKKDRTAKVRPFMFCTDFMNRVDAEHDFAAMSDDDFLAFYMKVGQQSGMASLLTALTSGEKEETAEPQADAIIEEAFASATAFWRSDEMALPLVLPGQTMIYAVRHDGKGMTFLPLPKANSAVIADMTGYRSSGMENASATALFWHQVMTVAPAIIPDIERSNEPVTALAKDDEANAATDMKPAYAVYLLNGSTLSVANARMNDSRILTIEPHGDVDTMANTRLPRFMDKKTRNTMFDRLAKPSVCAGYGDEKQIDFTNKDDRIRVTFKHSRSKELNGQLAFPKLTEFGTNWTHRVSGSFKASATASLGEESVSELQGKFLPVLVTKRKQDKPVTVSISDGKLGLKYDQAKTVQIEARSMNASEARVMSSDLLATLPTLLALDRDGGLAFEVDMDGLLVIEARTSVATFRVHIQTLESGRDTRNRKLLERVQATPKLVKLVTAEPQPADELAA